MVSLQQDSRENRFLEDKIVLRRLQSGLKLRSVRKGYPVNLEFHTPEEGAVAEGLYSLTAPGVDRSYWFHIALWFPKIYPACHPVLVLKDSRFPLYDLDRHIFSMGIACLGSPGVVLSRWLKSYDLEVFLSEVVNPWLVWQVCYDAKVELPPALEHGINGIYDAYRDIFGYYTDSVLRGFMILIVSEEKPESKCLCPCGSGKSLRRCHERIVQKARGIIPPVAASIDFENMNKQLELK